VIDRIHIEQLEVHGRVGVPDSERVEPQRLSLNVTLWPKIAELHDNIANTVNYSAVAQCAKEFVSHHNYKLIETLAEKIPPICWRDLICAGSRSKCANLLCSMQTMFQ
jgi:FolB domain-containing protein